MGKILGALLILEIFVLGLSEGFIRQKDLDDVGDGKFAIHCEKCLKRIKRFWGCSK